jgi:hypothetical protein
VLLDVSGPTSVSDRADPMTVRGLLKRPSAFVPLVMSAAALFVVALRVAWYGIAPQADEGTSAHLWQLLMACQLPVLAFFAIRWLPPHPKQALAVLALQAGAILASLAPVYLLGF